MNNPFEKKKSELDEKEQAVLKEARKVIGKPFLKLTDILEWSELKFETTEGEKVYFLPVSKVYVKVEE